MGRYAVVDSAGLIVNVVEWDGLKPWSPPPGTALVAEADAPGIEPGAKLVAGKVERRAPVPMSPGEVARRAIELQAQIDASAKVAVDFPGVAPLVALMQAELDALKVR